MALTLQEESILRLMIAELTARKKLDLERQALNADIVTTVNPINAQVVANHKTAGKVLWEKH